MNPRSTTNDERPTLRGWLAAYYIPYRGKKLGPYYAHCWRVRGKIKKRYIKHNEVERIRAAISRYRERRQRQRQHFADFTNQIGNLNYLVRMCKRLKNGPLRPEDYAHIAALETTGINTTGRPKIRTTRDFMYHFSDKSSPAKQGGSTQRGMGAYAEASDTPERASAFPNIPNPKSEIQNPNSPTGDTALAMAIWKQVQKEKLQEERRKETLEQKRKRWREAHKQIPKPGPPFILALPSWITQEKMDDLINEGNAALTKAIADKVDPNIGYRRLSCSRTPTLHPRNRRAVAAGLQPARENKDVAAGLQPANQKQDVTAGLQPANQNQDVTARPQPTTDTQTPPTRPIGHPPVPRIAHPESGGTTSRKDPAGHLRDRIPHPKPWQNFPKHPQAPTTSEPAFSEELRRFKGDV